MGNPGAVEEAQQDTQREKETERFITSTHSDFNKKQNQFSCLPVPVLFTVNLQDIHSKKNKCRSPGHLTAFK